MKPIVLLAFFAGLSLLVASANAGTADHKPKAGPSWSRLPDLPDPLGVAGPFVGVHENALMVAGGANFPDGVPWHLTATGEKSQKRYHDSIYVLLQEDRGVVAKQSSSEILTTPAGKYRWVSVDQKLHRPLAYGVSVSTVQGLLCIGGEWQEHSAEDEGSAIQTTTCRSDKVFLLQWDYESQTVARTTEWEVDGQRFSLPSLPVGTTAACGGKIGDYVYLAGGNTGEGGCSQFLRFDLRHPANSKTPWQWEVLPSWNGPPRSHAIGVVQAGMFFLFSGRNKLDGRGFEILTDAHRFDPREYARELKRARRTQQKVNLASYANGWKRLAEIAPAGESARCVMAGTGIDVGYDSILIFGGARGDVLVQCEEILPRQIKEAKEQGDGVRVEKLQEAANALYDHHKGFSSELLQYHITTDTWSQRAEMPFTSPVTTTAVRWNDLIVLPTGENHPGVRTREIWTAGVDHHHRGFGTVNWIVLTVYLGVLVGIGFVFAKRESDSDDFFLASGRIPWWAAGLSIFGTSLSAITYLSIPARSYATNWSWSLINCGIPLVALVIAIVYLPRLIRLQAASAYEFLEQRFHISLRWFGSVSFILYQLGRMGIVVLLPALALSAVTGLNLTLCIVTMGLLSTLYTVLGGIEAVIWTDVVQVVVLLGGALVALVVIFFSVDGGLSEILKLAAHEGKLNLVNEAHFHNLDWADDNILVILLAAFFVNLIPYSSDQSIVQRYLTVSNESNARWALWTNALMSIPASMLFFLVGTALWVFYQTHPMNLVPLSKPDQIFPWFIAQELPAGLAGLVIAGVFAAAMSSLDSSMHSAATVVTTDFFEQFGRRRTPVESLRFARWATVIFGILGIGSAMLMATVDIRFLWDMFQAIIGLFLGTVGGLFSLGILTKRVSTLHAWAGAIASVGLLGYVQTATEANGLLYGAISVVSCMAVALLASFVFPGFDKNAASSEVSV